MNCSNLDVIFPGKVSGSIETPSSILLNALPTLSTFFVFCTFILLKQPSKRVLPKYISFILIIACLIGVELLIWRMYELMECKNETLMIPYKFLIIILFPIVSLLILVLQFYRNYYRTSSFIFLSLGSSMVAVDYYTRLGMHEDIAQPVFPTQTLLCTISLLCLLSGKYTPLFNCLNICSTQTEKNCSTLPSSSMLGREYCVQPNIFDPTSRHPSESKGVNSAPESRSVWN